jgi:hypothetical protein
MPGAFRYLAMLVAIGALAPAAERRSWNHVRYIGGTVSIKASPYDWNTTVTLTTNPETIVLAISPGSVFGGHQQTLRIKGPALTAVVCGPGAWQRVADVPGAQLPAKPHTLFGLLERDLFLGILYQGDDGKPCAVLLDSYLSVLIAKAIETVTGKTVEYVK